MTTTTSTTHATTIVWTPQMRRHPVRDFAAAIACLGHHYHRATHLALTGKDLNRR